MCTIVSAPILLTLMKTRGRIAMKIIADNYINVWGIFCQQSVSGIRSTAWIFARILVYIVFLLSSRVSGRVLVENGSSLDFRGSGDRFVRLFRFVDQLSDRLHGQPAFFHYRGICASRLVQVDHVQK